MSALTTVAAPAAMSPHGWSSGASPAAVHGEIRPSRAISPPEDLWANPSKRHALARDTSRTATPLRRAAGPRGRRTRRRSGRSAPQGALRQLLGFSALDQRLVIVEDWHAEDWLEDAESVDTYVKAERSRAAEVCDSRGRRPEPDPPVSGASQMSGRDERDPSRPEARSAESPGL
jgi:hypothetical protein